MTSTLILLFVVWIACDRFLIQDAAAQKAVQSRTIVKQVDISIPGYEYHFVQYSDGSTRSTEYLVDRNGIGRYTCMSFGC